MKICRTFLYENLYAIFSIHSQHTQKHAPSVVETEHLKRGKKCFNSYTWIPAYAKNKPSFSQSTF